MDLNVDLRSRYDEGSWVRHPMAQRHVDIFTKISGMLRNAIARLNGLNMQQTQQGERSTYENATFLPALNDTTGFTPVASCRAPVFPLKIRILLRCCVFFRGGESLRA
jgi:hypothetical protein